MMINNEIILSFLNCRYKAFLKYNHELGTKTEYEIIENELMEMYKRQFFNKIHERSKDIPILDGFKFDSKIDGSEPAYAIKPSLKTKKYYITLDAFEIWPPKSPSTKRSHIAIFISKKEKISKLEKLFLCIKCKIIEDVSDITTEHGKIIYGKKLKSTKFALNTYTWEANKILREMKEIIDSKESPRLYQTNHCQICEFQARCREILIEKDDLSLLARMSPKEVIKQNSKGIFTINQLSYTFRPKKRKKPIEPLRIDYALKALALREKQTYIIEIPNLTSSKVEIYLDMEGLPDENFIYLIGVLIRHEEKEEQFSFWADSAGGEEKILSQFFNLLTKYKNFTIYHYGSYEIRSLKRLKKKFKHKFDDKIDSTIDKSVNILTFFSQNIYPPTYSNKLTDIADFLRYRWSEANASGIQSIVWRKKWELSSENIYKNKLIEYNRNDCEALYVIKKWIDGLESKARNKDDESFAKTSDLQSKSYRKWGDPNFQIPEFEEINKCSYFDYQRSKIYLRTNKNIKKAIIRKRKYIKRINKTDKILNSLPIKCPNCGQDKFYRLNNKKKLIINIKFMKNGIKKWNLQLPASAFQCSTCGDEFSINKNGRNLMIWTMNQYITYLTSMPKIGNMILEYFNISVSESTLYKFKSDLAKEYQSTYEEIKQLLLNGSLIHADETKTAVKGNPSGYVWVFTSMDTVYYQYRANREAEFLKDMLKVFRGVLVSDFFPGYYSLKCAQQKCLIHLIRDLNGDLLNNQLNTEYRSIVIQFGTLLRKIVRTIDKYGLKKKYLNKHKKDIEKYYHQILYEDYETELAISWQKRFKKNKGKLFTFLNYDNIPWNNNNSENAIKPFAKYRTRAKGLLRKEGVQDFLVLLSINQTCKYRGINFFDFLKSGEKSIEEYCKRL